MKKTLLAALAGVAMLASLVSCGSTPVEENKGVHAINENLKKHAMIDYKGSDWDLPKPQWILDVLQSNKAALSGIKDEKGNITTPASLPGTENDHLFIASQRGPNLNFLQAWVDSTAIFEVAGRSFEACIASANESAMSGGNINDNVALEQSVNNLTEILSSVRLTGLDKKADFWALFETYDDAGVPNGQYYEYYVVYGMPETDYQLQMKKALDKADETTTEAKELKKILKQKLSEQVLDSPAVEAEE